MNNLDITKEYLEKYDECLEIIERHVRYSFNYSLNCRVLKRHILAYSDGYGKYYRHLIHSNFKIIYFKICKNRKNIVKEICEKYNLKYLEKDYRKEYLCFEIKDDINYFYVYLKMVFGD